MKKIMIYGIFMLMILPMAMSFEKSTYCLNSTTLIEETKLYYYIDGALDKEEIWNHTFECLYGCANNRCEEASILSSTFFIVFFSSSLIMMLISAISGNDTFGMIGALIIMLLGVYLAVEGLVVNEILHNNTLTRMIALSLILIGLYTMYAFGASQFGKKGEDDELSG